MAGRGMPQRGAPAGLSTLIHEEKGSHPCQIRTYERSCSEESNESQEVEAGSEEDQGPEVDPIILEGNRQGLERFPDRLGRYHRGHSRAGQMAGFVEQLMAGDEITSTEGRRLRKTVRKLRSCGDHLVFRHYFTIDLVRLAEGQFCQQDKLCPLCALRRGAKLLRRYTERTLAVLSQQTQLKPYMVTQTVRDGPDLGERFRHLVSSATELHDRRNRFKASTSRRQWPWTEAVLAEGSVESIEIKRGDGSGEWHPHNHSVWLCPRPPDQQLLAQEWKDITGDSHIVHVQPFYYVRDNKPATPENISRDLCEVFKYSLKLAGMPLPDNWHAYQTLQGKHMIRPRGLLRGVKIPEDLADDPLTDEDLPYVQWFYRYTDAKYVLEHFA